MASILELIKQRGLDFDDANACCTVDYSVNHAKLVDMISDYGYDAMSVATGLKVSTLRQHYRDKSGKAMISDQRIERAEYALKGINTHGW